MIDRLRSMQIFVAVADAQSFTGAAQGLGLSRSMVSKLVMELETHLGARLLNRTTRRVSLTPTGVQYLERARRILADVSEAEDEVGEQATTLQGRIRLNAPMSFGISHVAAVVADFMLKHPAVQVDLVLNDRRIDLVEEGFDLAVRIGHLADSSLIARRLCVEPLVICASPDYLAKHGTPQTPADLAEHRCLDYVHSGGETAQWAFSAPDGTAEVARIAPVLRCNNGDAISVAAVQGLGIAEQPRFLVEQALASGRLVQVLEGYAAQDLPVAAVYPQARLMSARVRALIDHLVKALGRRS